MKAAPSIFVLTICICTILLINTALAPRILCVTDSTGYRKTPVFLDNEGWPYRIGDNVTHLGVCGGEVSHLFMSYHAKYGNRVQFDCVVIRLGGNDLNEIEYDAAKSNALFEKFITDLRANGVKKIIVVKYERMKPSAGIDAMNAAQKKITERLNYPYIDCKLQPTDFDADDDVHPNENGVRKIADAVKKVL